MRTWGRPWVVLPGLDLVGVEAGIQEVSPLSLSLYGGVLAQVGGPRPAAPLVFTAGVGFGFFP